ncbi:tyrosine-protein phosphatase non-receptor type 22 isoform X2 [Takifugu flavidus]|uniref:tyrosine-protein phosphatase non-receptor type 22 isoform X2 n=1 Tax=Takifugu flavidus TaxID=433684 RepID=UPI0025447D31|nr:tyrosine-protein phosphatase non-receptor type 22 isoform X2 [Takifugu flavidus]
MEDTMAGFRKRLKIQSTKYRTDKTYSSKTAEKQENIKRNRYKDIVPFDHSRVKLNFTTPKNDSDYINASFIRGVSSSTEYIATQGPLPHTLLDFFRMLWEHNTEVVVMACREFEMGKKKCERYWPQKEEPPLVCEPFTVRCESEENRGDYLTRTLQVTYNNCSRTLKQLHYVTWPDHGVPESIPSILQLLDEMRSYQTHGEAPICIHCSAGCGRTGVLCVIDYTRNLLKNQMITADFNIYDLVLGMRKQRPSLVQTKEQYELVYRTVKLLFERHLQSVDIGEMTVVSSSTGPDIENEHLDLKSTNPINFQQILIEERDFLPQYQDSTPSTSQNVLVLSDNDTQMHQQQGDLLQDAAPEGPGASLQSVDSSEELLLLDCPTSPTMAAAICLMVEDPYFDRAMSSPTEEAPKDSPQEWRRSPELIIPSLLVNDQDLELNAAASGTVDMDEEIPPPLPQRTPESYILAVDAGLSDDSCERLPVIIPPNAAAEAVRELRSSTPSPVPSLPERTPESFELATDQAPADQDTWAVDGGRTPPEWCSQPAASSNSDMKLFLRSRSLKTKSTFTAHPDLGSSTRSNYRLSCPPLDPPILPLLSPAEENHDLHPPRGASPEVTTEDRERLNLCPPGSSFEWNGTSRAKKFLDVVKTRSKSVRAKSTKPEPPAAAQPLTSAPVVMAEGGSAHVSMSRKSSLTTNSSGNNSDESPEKSMSRTKSLKIFRKKFALSAPPAVRTSAPPPTENTSFSIFRFGFGNRFRKPKGPRSYPETWF